MVCFLHQPRRWLAAVFFLAALGAAGSTVLAADEADDRATTEPEARIARLIEQLGSPQHATREKAHAELARLGLVAFDALDAAKDHDDIEIALRARNLLRRMRVSWTSDDDPVAVKRILRGYDDEEATARESRMRQLAALDGYAGTEALCRLVRFEKSVALSKRGALLVMSQEPPEDEAGRRRLAKRIDEAVAFGRRTAARWLTAYAQSLVDREGSLAAWDRLSREEWELFNLRPEQTSRKLVRDLLRWRADLLTRSGRSEQATAVMRQSLSLLEGTAEDILEAVDWLIERRSWELVEELAQQYGERFRTQSLFMYRLAEAQLHQGKNDLAKQTAAKALMLDPEEPAQHVVTAYSLQERGLFPWAEDEYRRAIAIGPARSIHDLRSRMLLSEMLHDMGREEPAGEALKGVVEAMDKDPAALQTVQERMGREPGAVRSRMHYFFAQHLVEIGEHEKHRNELRAAMNADPTDADVLIAMYRAAGADKDWRTRTLELIEEAAGENRRQIKQLSQQVEQIPDEQVREWAMRQLATACNQFAWLVGNTEGNYDEALQASQRSLELRPDTAGYLDTLGRCYYAKGDLENAIKHQLQAVKLEPHSGQIRRQLEFFQKALAEREKKD
jgi:tetratricopeptide (TPR) repeat protein